MNIDTNEIFVGKVGFDLMHDFVSLNLIPVYRIVRIKSGR